MIVKLWKWILPARFEEQLDQAERARDHQEKALQRTIRKDPSVDAVVARLVADRRQNNYGPTIARALGTKTQ